MTKKKNSHFDKEEQRYIKEILDHLGALIPALREQRWGNLTEFKACQAYTDPVKK